MSVRENFTVQLRLPDRMECAQDYDDVYEAFAREANAYARKRTSTEWRDRDDRYFVTYWWSGSLKSSRDRLRALFPNDRDTDEAYLTSVVDALEHCKKSLTELREVLGMRKEDDAHWWQDLGYMPARFRETIDRVTRFGDQLRLFVTSAAERVHRNEP